MLQGESRTAAVIRLEEQLAKVILGKQDLGISLIAEEHIGMH